MQPIQELPTRRMVAGASAVKNTRIYRAINIDLLNCRNLALARIDYYCGILECLLMALLRLKPNHKFPSALGPKADLFSVYV
jgi:hypothetical protein